jgi:hypothetical protein
MSSQRQPVDDDASCDTPRDVVLRPHPPLGQWARTGTPIAALVVARGWESEAHGRVVVLDEM